MPPFVIAVDDPRTADVHALLERHLAFAKETTPAEDVHAFGPARALYAASGFTTCGPFDGYSPSGSSAFMTRMLDS